MNSKFLSWSKNDVVKGVAMAFGAGAIVIILEAVQSCGISCVEWVDVLNAGTAGGLFYLIKNFFTNSDGVPLKGEQ